MIGSGKWAKLIYSKLSRSHFNVTIDTVGSENSFCKYHRNNIHKAKKNSSIIIASATKNHFEDLKLCLELEPETIYVEKGFSSIEEYEEAKSITKEIPIYILSQYRYSGVFYFLKKHYNVNHYDKIDYTWKLNNSEPSEWLYHILSIDNFIKNKNNKMIAKDYGFYRIDSVSDINLIKSDTKELLIEIQSDDYYIKIVLGTSNTITMEEKNKLPEIVTFQNEDCLYKQLEDIFLFKNNNILERL